MTRLVTLTTLLTLCVFLRSPGQVYDNFEDGELTSSPEWFGDTHLFTIVDINGNKWLQSNGSPTPDTLVILTPSAIAFGTWDFHYQYRGGKPTNFNHARLILAVPDSQSTSPGHLLQLGSNDGSLRLYEYRDLYGSRTLLAQSEPGVFDEDSLSVSIRVERTYSGTWTVFVDEIAKLSVHTTPDVSETVSRVGFWIKHTAGRGDSHRFDELHVRAQIASDSTAPRIERAIAINRFDVAVTFDEPVLTDPKCLRDSLLFLPAGVKPSDVSCPAMTSADSITVRSSQPLNTGTSLLAFGLTDHAGNVRVRDTIVVDIDGIQHLARQGDLVINEIDYAPSPAEAEYVEIMNRSDRVIDITSLTLADDRSAAQVGDAAIPLAPGELIALTRDLIAFASRFPSGSALEVPQWPSLNNGGDLVAILASTDTIDAVRYDPSWSSTAASLERVDPSSPSDYPGNWRSSEDARGGTPGRPNSVFHPDVTPPELLSASLKSGGDAFVSLRFSEAIPSDTLRTEQFLLDGATARRVLTPHLKYSDTVVLEYAKADHGTVVARDITDAAGNVTPESEVRLRLQPHAGSIVINEVLYEPRADAFDGLPDQPEFLEIRSLSPEPLTVSDCILSGPANEDGVRDILNLSSDPFGLSPHGLAVVVGRDDAQVLRNAFPNMPEDSEVLTIRESSLRLSNSGTLVALECAQTGVIDEVWYRPEWHDDTMADVRGRSLERIDPTRPANDFVNWSTSHAARGATPGAINSIAPPPPLKNATPGDVIITEIMFEPRTEHPTQFEYVEIRNVRDEVLDLNGFSLADRARPADSSGVRIAYGPTLVQPGQFLLVANLPTGEAPSAFATDAELIRLAFPSYKDESVSTVLRRSKLSLPNGGGSLELRDHDGLLIEAARYSPNWHHPHLAGTRGISLERISQAAPASLPTNWTSSVDPSGGTPGSPNSVQLDSPVGTRRLEIVPSVFFPDRDGERDHVAIRYSLESARPFVQLTIFDSRGRAVRRMARGMLSGPHGSTIWDGADDHGVPARSGIYVVHLRSTDVAAGTTEDLRGVVVLARSNL